MPNIEMFSTCRPARFFFSCCTLTLRYVAVPRPSLRMRLYCYMTDY